MKRIRIETSGKKMLADIHTPVGIYLRLRDRFRDTILLESTDHHVSENSYSFICINAIGGIEISSADRVEFKLPGREPERVQISEGSKVPELIWEYMGRMEAAPVEDRELQFAQGLYGYTSFDAVQFFDKVALTDKAEPAIPLMRYRLYQYVIAINHHKDILYLCENRIAGIESDLDAVESLIRSKDVPVFPFRLKGNERSNMSDENYVEMVKKGIKSCMRGDVFQIVLSRRFEHSFTGDEFNVYRALRSINPSPYLFFFDYGNYKLFGSSPEAQIIVQQGKAVVHPIAGTFRRTGDEKTDQEAAARLLKDAKENAEHVMLVDLARNDLSRVCSEVEVSRYRQVQYYSHVIHLVSEVTGKVKPEQNPFELLAKTFPAGTLSGAPKIRAIELIDALEPTSRGYYGGAIGFAGFDGSFNHAIMIRTFLSRNNTLVCQAGAGVVAASVPESELQEVNNKLNALKTAAKMAETIHP
ncbi:MAG: anthranilate synthase component I family protein [Sediminibacterium sp.]|nr:anthranilate synthase component I family protein [Sediminibacterium sp.]